MSNLDEFNTEALKPRGGKWIKLSAVGDAVKGELLDIETVNRTDPEGNVVLSRKTGNPRKVIRVRIQTELRDDTEDTGERIFDANESAQDALRDAAKKTPFQIGGTIAIKLVEAAPTAMSQAKYTAAFKAPVAAVAEADLF
jgi:hypothetical protein